MKNLTNYLSITKLFQQVKQTNLHRQPSHNGETFKYIFSMDFYSFKIKGGGKIHGQGIFVKYGFNNIFCCPVSIFFKTSHKTLNN